MIALMICSQLLTCTHWVWEAVTEAIEYPKTAVLSNADLDPQWQYNYGYEQLRMREWKRRWSVVRGPPDLSPILNQSVSFGIFWRNGLWFSLKTSWSLKKLPTLILQICVRFYCNKFQKNYIHMENYITPIQNILLIWLAIKDSVLMISALEHQNLWNLHNQLSGIFFKK